MKWDQIACAACGDPLPERGFKRRAVPRRGVRLRSVCDRCAAELDAEPQGMLTTETGEPLAGSRAAP